MVAVALVLWGWLDLTGVLLLALGVLGALHGLLLPTKWIQLLADGHSGEPFCVLAPRKKSGRQILKLVQERLEKANPKPALARA